MSKLGNVFEKAIAGSVNSDSSMVATSDDMSTNTYSISKFYTADEYFDFDVTQFISDLQKKFEAKNIEKTSEGFMFEKQFGMYTLNYELELYSDASASLEIYASGSSKDSEDLVLSLGKFMVSEFNDFSNILNQKDDQ